MCFGQCRKGRRWYKSILKEKKDVIGGFNGKRLREISYSSSYKGHEMDGLFSAAREQQLVRAEMSRLWSRMEGWDWLFCSEAERKP